MARAGVARIDRPGERPHVNRPAKPATVRKARLTDAGRIAELCNQLGYPSTRREVAQRLAGIRHDPERAVFVAELSSRKVAGWIHVGIEKWLESDAWAEVGGLVIDDRR